MKFENFKSGVYLSPYQYKSFLPTKINQEWTWDDPRINVLLEKATQSLEELNAFSRIVPNVDLNILQETTGYSRNRIFLFSSSLTLLGRSARHRVTHVKIGTPKLKYKNPNFLPLFPPPFHNYNI